MKSRFQKSIAIGLVFVSNYAVATSCCLPHPTFCYDGFYVGGNVGIGSLTDEESTNTPIIDTHDLGASGWIGGVFAGYDFTLSEQFKLGVEVFTEATDLSAAANQAYPPNSSYVINTRYNLGIRLLPGFEFTPGTVGHIIVGYASGRFDIGDNGNFGVISSHFSRNGIQYGLGIKTQTPLLTPFSIRGDVIWTSYANKTSNGVTTTIPVTTQVYRNNSMATLEASLALVYKFA